MILAQANLLELASGAGQVLALSMSIESCEAFNQEKDLRGGYYVS